MYYKDQCCCSVAKLCPTFGNPMDCSILGFPVLYCPPEFAQTRVCWIGDLVQPSHPLSPHLFLPSIFPSIRVFSNELALHIRWPKYWNFSFSISPSNEYSRLISFRMDWFGLLAVQETLKSLLQQHRSKASILQHSAFSVVQLSHSYMTTGKTIALTVQTFVSKVMSLLSNMLYAAAAKSLESCPTLCHPIDSSPPDSGILQARTLESAAYQAPPGGPWDFPGKSTGVGCHCLLWICCTGFAFLPRSKRLLISWQVFIYLQISH